MSDRRDEARADGTGVLRTRCRTAIQILGLCWNLNVGTHDRRSAEIAERGLSRVNAGGEIVCSAAAEPADVDAAMTQPSRPVPAEQFAIMLVTGIPCAGRDRPARTTINPDGRRRKLRRGLMQ
jgi:hypothetical protein